MRHALSADAMRAAETEAVGSGYSTLAALMERAGAAVASEVTSRVPAGPVLVACGPGNNGGDGWVAARLLAEVGRAVRVVAVRPPDELSEPAREAAQRAVATGVPWSFASDLPAADSLVAGTRDPLGEVAGAVDAIFGFGFRGPARGAAAGLIGVLEALRAAGATVVAVDLPSGVCSDTGTAEGPAVRATVTVTFSALKPGLLIEPGRSHAGDVVVADLGLPAELVRAHATVDIPGCLDIRRLLPVSRPDDHKGSRGRVAVVAGSRAYGGAAVLAAQGALRMGAGYVYVVTPASAADAVRVALPNVIVRALAADTDGALADPAEVMEALVDVDAVVAGPGLTIAPAVDTLVRRLLRELPVPLLLDADALNVLAGDLEVVGDRIARLVLTPHPGEAARLLGTDVARVQSDRLAAASALAAVVTRADVACVLKGPGTIVAPGCGAGERRAGPRPAIICAGNAGLARAGSGDVLAGMIGTLLARGLASSDAASLGVYLHGRAAEIGTARLTEMCFTSTDIVGFLTDAVREVSAG